MSVVFLVGNYYYRGSGNYDRERAGQGGDRRPAGALNRRVVPGMPRGRGGGEAGEPYVLPYVRPEIACLFIQSIRLSSLAFVVRWLGYI